MYRLEAVVLMMLSDFSEIFCQMTEEFTPRRAEKHSFPLGEAANPQREGVPAGKVELSANRAACRKYGTAEAVTLTCFRTLDL